ncbi:MAG: hypothetical protein JST00_08455 [Deltaproteobacteria bacterium]|nr:hypothetical protein [Deltaproteobacteria bacterium]
MSTRFVPAVLASLAAVVTLACSSSPETEPGAACDVNPETPVGDSYAGSSVAPQSVATNRLAANGVRLNRIAINRIAINRIAINRIAINRIAINRLAANGVRLNGVELAGVQVKAIAGSSNELVGSTSDGRILRGADFVGAKVVGILSDESEIELDITGFERTDDPSIVHYALSFQGQNLCEAGTGMFVPGTWDDTATFHARDANGLTTSYTCVDGVIGKCAHWGYASWKAGSDMHAACTRMGTADYCGTGISYTKDGTAIDMYDAKGIQRSEGDASFRFEAGWGPGGATCVSRPRYDAVTTSGKATLPSCWKNLPLCEAWTSAQQQGAIVGNSSRVQTRTLCE